MRPVLDPDTRLPVGPEVEPAAAARPDRDLTLEGRRVRLVPVDPAAHAEALFACSHGPGRAALWQYLSSGPFPDLSALRASLEVAAGSDDPLTLAILDRDTGRAVGHACLMRIEPGHRVVEVGNILFTPALQRGPGGTEAIFLLARHAFEDLGVRRLEWKCDALNAPSRRAAGRYGFTYEGTFRQHMIVKGRSRDTAWYAMLDRDWPARRRAFECWLHPSNFDGDGRQRLALSSLNAATVNGSLLRRASPDDGPAFGSLQEAAFGPSRAALGREPVPLLSSPAEVIARTELWLLEEADGLAGALALVPAPGELEVWSVAVAPARQGAGLGRALLAAAEERARALGLSRLRLFTGEESRAYLDWYERRGYATERLEETPDGRRLVHMTKTI